MAAIDHVLSPDERHAACAAYLSRYGHLLPSELTEGYAARVRARFPQLLAEHPRMLQRVNRIGRT